MFTHPPVSDETTHPYERDCQAHDLVANQWGQRVTSLVPVADSLFIGTSAKWPCKWEPRFDFLPDGKWQEYGSVIRLRMPGSLSAPVQWTEGPTELAFAIEGGTMRVEQDGRELDSAGLGEALAAAITTAGGLGEVEWGTGVFGRFGGKSVEGGAPVGGR
jgi:hypothetical protein